MFLHIIKKRTDKALMGFGKWLGSLGITPNMLTFVSLLFVIAAFFLFLENRLWVGILALFLHYVLDALDGVVARATNNSTVFGMFFDRFVDVLRFFCWIPFAMNGYVSYNLVIWVVSLGLLAAFCFIYYEITLIKRVSWVPTIFNFLLFFAVLTGQMYWFALLSVILNGLAIVSNVMIVFYMNVLQKSYK